MTNIDNTDLEILKILQDNARITNQELAQLIHLSPSSCLMRVRKLEEIGVLASYHANIDLKIICRVVQCIVTVSIHSQTRQDFEQFPAFVETIPEVLECFTVSGEFDFLLRVVAPNMERYLSLTDELLDCIEGEMNLSTHVIMKENKRANAYPLESLL